MTSPEHPDRPSNRRRKLGAGAAVIAAATLICLWLYGVDSPQLVEPPGLAGIQNAKPTQVKPALLVKAPPAGPGCPLALGRDYHYQAQASVVLDRPDRPAVQARWALSLRALQRDADGTTVVAARMQRDRADPADAQPWPDVAPPFLVRLDRACGHLAYAWQRDADLEGARFQQGRAAMFAFTLPESSATPTTGEAADDNGRYRFAAVRTEVADGAVVRLQNRGYRTAVSSAAQQLPAAVSVEGPGLTVHLSRERWVTGAELAQVVRVAVQPGRTASVQARLQAVETGLELAGVDANSPGWVWGNLLLDSAAQHRARLRPDPKLVGMAPADLFALLQAADPAGERVAQGLRYLEAWLLANPAGAEQLRDWLRGESARYTDNPWARMALAALGRCGLPRARAALRALTEDPKLASAMRLHALLNLATAEGLDPADGEFLRGRAQERVAHGLDSQATQDSASALAALGIAARHPNLQGTPTQAAALQDLRTALHTETDEVYLQAAVNGAGNAADPALLPDLEPLAKHPSSDIRRRVADALRAMPAESIEAWFAPWLDREPVPAVAAQLIAAYAQHYSSGDLVPAAVLDPALARLPGEANAAVALQLVGLVGKASAQSAAAKAALVAKFAQESGRGAAADVGILQAIGAFVDAATLAGAK